MRYMIKLEVSTEHMYIYPLWDSAITTHLLQTVPLVLLLPGTDCIILTHLAYNMELLRIEFERIDNGDECAY